MKKKYALVIALLVLLACCSSAIAETSYSAGSVYHTFITTGYECKTYSSMYWRHVTCYAYSASRSGNSGIYYDGVRLSSNSQMFRPVDSNGNYMGYEERVYSGSYERAYCYEGQSGSRMYLKVSKPEGISDSVKISTYGFFVGTVGT